MSCSSGLHVEPRSPQRRRQSKQNRRQHTNHERERESGQPDADVVHSWHALRTKQPYPVQRKKRQSDAQGAAGERKQHAFGQQLANDPYSRCTQRGAHCNFLLARDGARQLQVRQVHARDQQDKANRSEQQVQRAPNVAHHLLQKRHDTERQAAVGRIHFGKFMSQARRNGIHFGLCLLYGNPRLQLAQYVVVFVVAILGGVGRERKRQQYLGLLRAVQRRHHLAR